MDYKKIYDNLIETRKYRVLKEGEYYEKHHIVPRCLGGNDLDDNIVTLTAREHYVAHWLLVKIHNSNWRIMYAFFQMSKLNKKNARVITSSQYERAKRYTSQAAKIRMADPEYNNPGKTTKSREIARNRMKIANPMTLDPSKNHSAKKVVVYYLDGTIKEFNMYKSFIATLPKMSGSTARQRIKEDWFLKSVGIDRIVKEAKETAGQGRTWYTDGKTNIYIKENEMIPEGFKPGMAPYKRTRNGKEAGHTL